MTYTAPNLVKMKLDIKQVRFGIITEALSCQGPAVYATCLDISIGHIRTEEAVETPASYITKSSLLKMYITKGLPQYHLTQIRLK